MIFSNPIKQFFINSNKTIFVLVVILLLLFSCKSSGPSKEKASNTASPNFILILTDDQGWNGTSVKMMHNEIGSKFYIYKKKKYGITCEKKFEIDENNMITGVSSRGCF